MKTITATKISDGYLVKIKETRHLHSETDVIKFIKQSGLKIKEQFSIKGDKGDYIKIFSE